MVAVDRGFFFATIVVLALLTPKPAVAGWGSTLSDGCGTSCSTPKAVCDYWGAYYGGGCLSLGPPVYLNNGRMNGMVEQAGYVPAEPIITFDAYTFCSDPYVDDGLAPGGCSLAVTVPQKQLGCGCTGQGMIGNPITINIGNKFETATDFETDGQDSLSFIRYYNSQLPQRSFLGYAWRSNFDRGFRYNGGTIPESTVVWFIRPDGSVYSFSNASGAWVSSDSDINATLTSLGSSGWILTDDHDNIETYTLSGQLSSIKTRSGYEQDLNYDTNGNLISVADSFGRTLTFTIANGSIRTMTDPDGNVYTYNYQSLVTPSDQLVGAVFPGSGSPTVQYVYENTSYPYALTGVIDENGNRYATWSYDANLRATNSQHAGGADATTVSYSLGSTGVGTVTATNALGKQTTYTLALVAGVGKIVTIAGSASPHTPATTESFTYDSNGYVANHTDNNGNITQYVNDARGHITSETDAFGTPLARTITTSWDPTYNVPTQKVQPGLTTHYTYSSGLLTEKTETDTTTTTVPYSTNGTTRTWSYAYYPNGLLHTVTGPLGTGDTVTYTYDAHGCVASFTDQLGHATTITAVNGRCEPLSSSDANGIVTNYSYDNRGRIISVVVNPGPNQSVTGFTYDPAGNLTVITFPDSSTLTYAYDAAHRLTSVTNNLGESIAYSLDAMGDRTATTVKSASSVVTKHQSATFDELARVIANIGAASQTTIHAYDPNSNEIATTDPRGKVYGHTFDALNRLYQETDPDSGQTTIAFNGQDEVTGVTDARSLATTYVRDGFGDVIQRTNPDTGTDVFWYDANGNATKKIDARGIETDFTYDAASRILTQTFPAASAENVGFVYDATAGGNVGIGRLTSVTDQSGSTAFVFDALARMTSDTQTISGQSYVMGYTYDAAGNVLTETYPSGRIVNYTRDPLGRTAAITTQQNVGSTAVSIAASANYEPFGPLSAFTLGNGLRAALTFDQDYQLTNIQASNGTTAVQNLVNGFDPSGNITSITDSLAPSRSQTVTYDDLNRIATANGAYGSQSYRYDLVGNRLSRAANGSTDAYTYSATSNRLTSVTSTTGNMRSFTYAASGQLSQDVRDASHTYNFTVNNNGRNASASLNGSTVGSYLYNAFGQRVQKVAGGATTQFIYDRLGHLLEETNGSGSAMRDYIWLDDMPVAMVDDTGASPTIYYVHTDQLGTPQKITDGSANIVWDNVSDPFGNSVATQGTNWGGANWGSFDWAVTMLSLTNLRFPGQYSDAEAGLNQNWNRDYDPTTGRYVQSDPVWPLGGISTYAYANDNAISSFDPLGLQPRSGTEVLGYKPCNTGEAQQCRAQCGHRGVDKCIVRVTRVIVGVSGTGQTRYRDNRDVLCSCNDADSDCKPNEQSAFEKFMRGLSRPGRDSSGGRHPDVDDPLGDSSSSKNSASPYDGWLPQMAPLAP